jgi:hypothetical protein
MRWLPAPDNIEERLRRIADRVAKLDAALQADGCRRILTEVYREIDALDSAVKQRSGAGAGTGAAPATKSVLPAREDLAPSLHVLRQAILFMEEAYISEDLERRYNHPLYLGLMNYFARWAFAPIFRMWWPLLKSLYCREFTSFMERRFGLASVNGGSDQIEEVKTDISLEGGGFASHCWRLERSPSSRVQSAKTVLSFSLEMTYAGEKSPYRVEAALAFCHDDGANCLAFHADDFYVPPGLWGIGIGEAFLAALTQRNATIFGKTGKLQRIHRYLVAIPINPAARGVVRKGGADLTAMYRSAGFRPRTLESLKNAGPYEKALASLGDVTGVGFMVLDDDDAVKFGAAPIQGAQTTRATAGTTLSIPRPG